MKNPRLIRFLVITAIAIGGWLYKTKFSETGIAPVQIEQGPSKSGPAPKLKEDWKKEEVTPAPGPELKPDWNKKEEKKPTTTKVEKVNGYDRLTGCQLVDHKNNDGDSFHIKHNGRDIELRLYYVDTAEKYYSDRYENQRARVRDQAKDFGGISVDQVIELGLEAKEFTLELLEGNTFTVYTKWEEVYDSGRYYAFVEVPGTKGRYLSEILVASGLVRLHTKGEPTPDGRSYRQYRDHLNKTERAAKKDGAGAWGM